MNVVIVFDNKAATDLSAKDGYVVKQDSGAAVCTAITDQAIGVVTKGGDATELQSEVCIFGECQAVAGGTIADGAFVTPHTDGTVVTSAKSGCTEFGQALQAAVAGDKFRVFVFGAHKQWA